MYTRLLSSAIVALLTHSALAIPTTPSNNSTIISKRAASVDLRFPYATTKVRGVNIGESSHHKRPHSSTRVLIVVRLDLAD